MRGGTGGIGPGSVFPTVQGTPRPATGRVSPVAPNLPGQSTDEYWPWQLPQGNPTSGQAGVDHGFITPGSKARGQEDAGPGVADYVGAPEMPGFTPGGGDAAAAAAGRYVAYNPTLWNEPDIGIPEAGVNTREIVNALKPQLEEEMAAGMGNAARRFGSLGQLKGTGYADTLGNVERKMFSDLNALNYKYDYDAAQADANRKSAAREGTLGRAYGAWGQTEGMRAGEANRRTGYNVGQQDRADEMSRFNAGRADNEAARKGAFDWKKYSAGLSEAERQQMYDQLKLQFGG